MKFLMSALVFLSTSAAVAHPIVHTNKSVFVTSSPASSCLARRIGTETGKPPERDVQRDFIRIAKVDFLRFDNKEPMNIHRIVISVNMPDASVHTCSLEGNQVWALHPDWYKNKEAVLPANVERFTLGCEIHCGGMPSVGKMITTGNIEVYGTIPQPNGQEASVMTSNVFEVRRN